MILKICLWRLQKTVASRCWTGLLPPGNSIAKVDAFKILEVAPNINKSPQICFRERKNSLLPSVLLEVGQYFLFHVSPTYRVHNWELFPNLNAGAARSLSCNLQARHIDPSSQDTVGQLDIFRYSNSNGLGGDCTPLLVSTRRMLLVSLHQIHVASAQFSSTTISISTAPPHPHLQSAAPPLLNPNPPNSLSSKRHN